MAKYNNMINSGWSYCCLCEGLVAVIDSKTSTCGPTCNAHLLVGLCNLQKRQVSELSNDTQLNKWLTKHPKIKDQYEFNIQLTKDMVDLLRNKTSGYDSAYMKTLFNTWS